MEVRWRNWPKLVWDTDLIEVIDEYKDCLTVNDQDMLFP